MPGNLSNILQIILYYDLILILAQIHWMTLGN